MQQLDGQCAIKLESVAVLLVNPFFLCGVSDGSKIKPVSIKSPQNCFNLANHQDCFIWLPKQREGIFRYKLTYV